MGLTTVVFQTGLLVVSAVTTTALGVYAWRHRQEPGAKPFIGMVAVLTLWSGTKAIGFLTHDSVWRLLIYRVGWSAVATIGVWLLLFAVTYTGNDDFVTRRSVALLFAIPAVVIAGVWTNPWLHLVWGDLSVAVVDGIALVQPPPGPLFWVSVSYSYGLIIVASALLTRLVYTSDYLYADQSALLLVGIVLPFVLSLVYVSGGVSDPPIDYTAHAFTVTGVTFGYALYRRQLFDLVPATRRLGRNAAISQLDAGVVIVDNAHRIVYCNEAAGDILDCDPSAALGRETQVLVDESRLDFDADDALAEIERDGHTYEIRTSPVTDRRDRRIGSTLVIHDVTARAERERRLAAQRDQLERVDELNAVIRGVNQALVSASNREAIETAVCERVAETGLYETACIGDLATWTGDADRWLVAGEGSADRSPPGIDDGHLERSGADTDDRGGDFEDAPRKGAAEGEQHSPPAGRSGDAAETLTPAAEGATATLQTVPEPEGDGDWLVVPLVYGRTVYGALGLFTDRDEVGERERDVLAELGEIVGHAINAVEKRQLLSAEAVVELELQSEDSDGALAPASATTGCELEIAGLVPTGENEQIAYVRVTGDDPEPGGEALDTASAGDVRQVESGASEALFEWHVPGDGLLGLLGGHGANVRTGRADAGTVRYEIEVPSEAAARRLLDTVTEAFPGTRVVAKRERQRPAQRNETIETERLGDLTDRQEEVIEAAYRAGYFSWPRDSTAEEVAESLDISAPTLHSHLRKAEETLLSDLFERDSSVERPNA